MLNQVSHRQALVEPGLALGQAWRVLGLLDGPSYASRAEGPLLEEGLVPGDGVLLVLSRGGARLSVRGAIAGLRWTLADGEVAVVPAGHWVGLDLPVAGTALLCYLAGTAELGVDIPQAQVRIDDPVLVSLLEAAGAAIAVGRPLQRSLRYLFLAIGCHLADRDGAARTRAAPTPLLPGSVKSAILFMQRNLDRQIHIGDVAAAAGLSQSHLTREFRTRLSRSPHQHLIALRLSRAAELLRDTALPLAEVALACGFCHQEHFTRRFKQQFATTPARFRRLCHR